MLPHLPVFLFVLLFVFLSVSLSVRLSVCLSAHLSQNKTEGGCAPEQLHDASLFWEAQGAEHWRPVTLADLELLRELQQEQHDGYQHCLLLSALSEVGVSE